MASAADLAQHYGGRAVADATGSTRWPPRPSGPARAPADGTVPFAAAAAIPQLAAAPAAGFAVSPAPITGVTRPEQLLPYAVLTEGIPRWPVYPTGGSAAAAAGPRTAFLAAAAAALPAAGPATLGQRRLTSPVTPASAAAEP